MFNRSPLYEKLLVPPLKLAIRGVEACLLAGMDRPDFLPAHDLPWAQRLEASYREIRDELLRYREAGAALPAFSDISPEQYKISDRRWESVMLLAYGRPIGGYADAFARTRGLLAGIPGLQTAMFSVFQPGARLSPHRGPYAGLLRYHLALIVPPEPDQCALVLNGKTRHWHEGESLLFDDTFEHEAWNRATTERVVLFLDIERPLPPLRAALNRLMIFLIGRSPFIGAVLRNAERHAERGGAAAQ